MSPRNEYAATGMAILSAYVHHDEEGLAAVAVDLTCPQTIALLARASEAVVNMLAQVLGVTKEEALIAAATAVAAANDDSE